jgi:COP9 signalosome complex subunit 5
VRTISAGKVNLGAFRTYPKGYKPPDDGPSEYQTIPLSKIEDFGVHCKSYYSLDVSYFKSPMDKRLLDSLWNHYWVNTLSSSSLISNAEYTTGQISDLADKLETWDSNMARSGSSSSGMGGYGGGGGGGGSSTDGSGLDKKTEDKLHKATKDACKITTEVLHGIMTQVKHEQGCRFLHLLLSPLEETDAD